MLFFSLLHPYLICSRASPTGGLVSDHRFSFCVCLTLLLSGSLSELQKWKQATAEAEVRLTWETGAHVWTQTGTYATPAVAPVTESPRLTFLPFPTASFSLPPHLFRVCVTRQLTTSIKVRHLINNHWLSSHPPCRRTQVVLLLM